MGAEAGSVRNRCHSGHLSDWRRPTRPSSRELGVPEHLDAMTNQANFTPESSELWQRSFGDEGTNVDVSRLATSLRGIRSNAEVLTSRIAGSLPGLTIHDISHLDALWEVATTVAGNDFPLNPVEAYVFGAAVLLHDAGLCFEAYSGGRDALRETLEWRDAYGRLSRAPNEVDNLEQEADFETLRALHASQAARLAIEPWRNNGGELYVIDDRELRETYGRLIGDLASSHHWNLEVVVSRFATPRPPAPFFTSDWEVDSLKVACMLRVADAGHMDSRRAPSFLLRVLQMNSLSRAHWSAQNHLGKLTVSREDPTQLVIASTSPFRRSESSAWWVAFDLVNAFDMELRRCNDVLKASPREPRRTFARRGVAGSGNVKELVQYVETEEWEPTDSTVHVSDVAALVTNLGGEQLYGADADCLYIALRELIQNAADAVAVRRSLPSGREFAGYILVRLKGTDDGRWILQVDDNGVGMSHTTLTKDLLDFGRSFWASERAAREFPGIHASGYTPVGRFGIGFFSIFMAAKRVNVYSRRFDKGLDDARCLCFDSGLSLRPTLTSEHPDDWEMDLSTRIELEVAPAVISNPSRFTIRCNLLGHEDFDVMFEDYVASIVAGIDVPVFVETDHGCSPIHEGFPPQSSKRREWLEKLSYINSSVNEAAKTGLHRALPRLREIREGEKCYGLAAINVMGQNGGLFLSGKAVGGLVNPHSRFDNHFVGLIDYLPGSAQRGPGEVAAPRDSMESWMTEQIALLRSAALSVPESIYASYSIREFGFDPIDILQGLLLSSHDGARLVLMQVLRDSLRSGLRIGFPVSSAIGNHLDSHSGFVQIPNMSTCIVINNGEFNNARLSGGVPSDSNSLIGVVHRVLVNAGENPSWLRRENVYRSSLGNGDCLEVLL